MAYPMLNFLFEAEPPQKKPPGRRPMDRPLGPARCPRCHRAAAALFAQVTGGEAAVVHLRKDLCTKVSQEQFITTVGVHENSTFIVHL